jgi:hypothetical protein
MQSFRILWVLCKIRLQIQQRAPPFCEPRTIFSRVRIAATGRNYLHVVCLGFCRQGNGHSRADRRAETSGGQRTVPLCPESYVRRNILSGDFPRALFCVAADSLLSGAGRFAGQFIRARLRRAHLRKVFGEEYLSYCRDVPRWRPRFAAQSARR